MRNANGFALTTLLLLILIICRGTPTASAQAKYVGWHTDLQTAVEKAAQSGKPLFVVFRCVR